ncbi:MAG TPA: hypothetical protein VL485_29550 [Ktedonobacteraceae bacterium]|nr:hypothetical protein [Ktedonobacteraceae bacterium]
MTMLAFTRRLKAVLASGNFSTTMDYDRWPLSGKAGEKDGATLICNVETGRFDKQVGGQVIEQFDHLYGFPSLFRYLWKAADLRIYVHAVLWIASVER